jgi:UDP-N-acetylglucosamine acyltransferase
MSDDGQSIKLHPSAIVEPGASLAPGCIIHPYALVRSGCVLGPGVIVHPFAVLGGDPQDLGFQSSTSSGVHIGARTVIREHVTISRASRAGAATQVGSECFLMAGAHVAHDCHVGDRVVIANAVLLAGHVQIGERAFLGGGAVIHQFCRIGAGVMIGGGGRISRDVAPFTLAAERNASIGLNLVGLRRRGVSRQAMDELKRAYREVLGAPVGNPRALADQCLSSGRYETDEARLFLQFFREGRRGFARPRRAIEESASD